MKTTTKKDPIDRIAQSTGTRPTLVKRLVQHFLDEIASELARGKSPGVPRLRRFRDQDHTGPDGPASPEFEEGPRASQAEGCIQTGQADVEEIEQEPPRPGSDLG